MVSETEERRRSALRKILEEREAAGGSLNALATAGDFSESAVRGFLTGRTRSLNAKTYDGLAKATGLSVAALHGEDVPGIGERGQPNDQTAERLLEARVAAGYLTADRFADAHQVETRKYRDQENGRRAVTEKDARAYAGPLGTSWQWLLRGEGDAPEGRIDREPDLPLDRSERPIAAPGMVAIDELDIRVGAGGAQLTDFNAFPEHEATQLEVRRTWILPDDVTRPVSTSPSSKMKIVAVVGDSMEPEYRPGERVLVDLGDITPSPPGTFVVWDGLALVIKQAEHVAWSDPPEVLLKSINPRYETYRRPLGEAYIQGRVIGKWLFR